MNCRRLDSFQVDCTGQEGGLLAYFAGELPGELDITLRRGGEPFARLIFPEYVEVYEENCPAHHFDYNIYGAGYGYHHCFYQKKLASNPMTPCGARCCPRNTTAAAPFGWPGGDCGTRRD